MKRLLVILFTCHVCSQDLSTNEDISDQRSDRIRQFRSACVQQCDCSETACGLQVDCSFRMLTEVPAELSLLTECLDLSMNNISDIAVDAFTGLRQLKKLSLSGNHISELPQNAFAGLKKLEQLQMQDNRLEEVPANTVGKLPNLKDLNLGANYISVIAPDAFVRLDSLEHVWLDDNRLTEIPHRALRKAPTIKALALDMNRITIVRNGDLDDLPMLRVLLLKHNFIEKIENNAFEKSANIRIIDLSYNKLPSLPPGLKYTPKLYQLTLFNNKIESLPDFAFAENQELRTLSLTGNPIKITGKTAFTGLKYLQGLSLENAEDMREFPDLFGCAQLKSLTITGGKLNSVPRSLCAGLPSLQDLNLKGNRLRNISGLLYCGDLEHLDLSDNELTDVTFAQTKNMTKMRDLNLGNNKIQRLDKDSFSQMNHIEKLNLAHNMFTYLPMRGLGSLRELNVSGVRTMLYLPPIALFHNLRSLAAYYPYHCCQVANIPRKMDNSSVYQHLPLRGAEEGDFLPMTSPVQCSPGSGPMTPCDDLLPHTSIRIFWWLATISAFLLNGVILLSRGVKYCAKRRSTRPRATHTDEEMLRKDSDSPYSGARMAAHGPHYFPNLSQGRNRNDNDAFGMSLCQLALADLIVSFYAAVILSYDRSTRGNFAEHGAWWQQSALCHSAGFLLTFGTQLAFFTVAVMAIERFLATMHPLQTERHMKKRVLVMTLASSWVISLATGTVTLFGGAGDDKVNDALNLLPAKSGATCMPWTTEFAYVAVLVGVHVVVCLVVLVACALMVCARKKYSWLSARKDSRRQVFTVIAANVVFILPLALLALCVSGYMTYSDLIAGHSGEYWTLESNGTVLDMGQLLTFAMFVLPIRPLLNPVLYLLCNRALRRDLAYLGKRVIYGRSGTSFARRYRNRTLETAFRSADDVAQETAHANILFNRPSFSNDIIRQALAYDNGGVVSSSFASNRTPSVLLAPYAKTTGGGRRMTSSERRKQRRYSRSQREEYHAFGTDLAVESGGVTFHRGGVVSYNPANGRRKKILTVGCEGVNARDEFQHWVFPRVSNASPSDRSSASSVYPVTRARSTAVGSTFDSPDFKTPLKDFPCVANMPNLSSDLDCSFAHVKSPGEHHDSLAANTGHHGIARDKTNSHDYRQQTLFASTETLYDADLEVAEINSGKTPAWEENPFFNNHDTTKRLHIGKTSQRAPCRWKSSEDDCRSSASHETSNNCERTNAVYDIDHVTMRKEVLSAGGGARLTSNDMGKMAGSCEYCDSAASKDSGIHSEFDSMSGASFLNPVIGCRPPLLSTSDDGLKSIKISTLLDELLSPRRNRDHKIDAGIDDAVTQK